MNHNVSSISIVLIIIIVIVATIIFRERITDIIHSLFKQIEEGNNMI